MKTVSTPEPSALHEYTCVYRTFYRDNQLRQSKVTCYSLSEQRLFYVSNRHMVCRYSSFFENGLKKILGLFAAKMVGTDIGNGCAPDIVAYPDGKSSSPTQCGTQSAVDNGLTKPLKGEL